MFCMKCGSQLPDEAAFCFKCGCPVNGVAAQNNTANTTPAVNANAGQIVIANNAFDDGRYDEAYQLFAQLYAMNQNEAKVALRLGLATAAKDYFNNGIPNSTKELVSKAMELAKSESSSEDDFVSRITPYINDVKKVIGDTKSVVLDNLSTAVSNTSPMRSTGSMVADALFSPMASANRNLYEDRRTAENNLKIVNSAMANKKMITSYLDSFGSFVLGLVSSMINGQLSSDNPLYVALGGFVVSGEDAAVYGRLSATQEVQSGVYGLCYGEEKMLLNFKDVCCFLQINNKNHATSFAPPKGDLLMTNYKVVYRANKDKMSFEQSLEGLLRIEVGGPLSTHIVLVFPHNIRVLISPNPAGSQAVFVAALNEDLKMPNR